MESKPKALHIGSGANLLRDDRFDWVNIDKQGIFKPDLAIDVNDLLEFIDVESVDLIWTCHMLEHLRYPDEAENFLLSCLLILKKDCIIRIAVPDLRLVAGYYLERSPMLKTIYGKGKFYDKYDNAGDRFNYFMRAWEHLVTYDADMLHDLLEGVGFEVIGTMKFNQSSIGEGHYDRLENESIYYEAVKR